MNYQNIFDNLKNGKLPDADELHLILDTVSKILIKESNVLEIDCPLTVVGDLHGQYYDYLKILDLFDLPSDENKYIFLGDYVDRGLNSVELFLSVLLLKIIYKDLVILLRGNHETKGMAINYTFRQECRLKYDETIFLRFCEIFTFLPVCAIVNAKYFCIHGGIIPDLNVESLKKQDRFEELPNFHDVYWSDPDDYTKKYEESPRGAGFLFGESVTRKFLEENNFECIIRSHQLVETGFDSKFGGKVLTVWSAPNYVYSHGNGASVLCIKDDKIIPKYFEKADPQFLEDETYKYFNEILPDQ
ncbi:serine/threonine-protein phosphatase [Vairimorpha necatrix]|uniref:Serine/threonine-protein phosphatase n=1 Tax=Vairimorpha necatrix TaxID=6039 RepID=A0AAX4JE62_9MICR